MTLSEGGLPVIFVHVAEDVGAASDVQITAVMVSIALYLQHPLREG